MPKITFEELEKETSKSRLYPVYLIYGPENFLINHLVDKVKNVYQAETGAEVERYSARGTDFVSVVDGLNTVSMWSKGKLAIVNDASSLSAKSIESLTKYLASPSPSAVLILVASKFDGRSKLYKAISKSGAITEIKTIYEKQMPFWINKVCRSKNINISQTAASFMTGLVGTNLSAMSEAVEKMILYIGSKKTIDLEDAEMVLSDTSQKSIFDLTNSVGSKDLCAAEVRLTNLLRNNEKPVVIVNMLARHWRLLLQSRELMEGGLVSERELASKLRVNPFFVKDYIKQSKGFTKSVLIRGLKRLWQADIAVKSSPLPKPAILHSLIIDLAR